MKVIICGAGQVGWQIARHLAGERNDVTLVDVNADLVRRATETLDVQGVVGFASHPDVLEKAGARDADMLIAATHSDVRSLVDSTRNLSDAEIDAIAKALDCDALLLLQEAAHEPTDEETVIKATLQKLQENPMLLAAYMSKEKEKDEAINGEAGPDYDEPA